MPHKPGHKKKTITRVEKTLRAREVRKAGGSPAEQQLGVAEAERKAREQPGFRKLKAGDPIPGGGVDPGTAQQGTFKGTAKELIGQAGGDVSNIQSEGMQAQIDFANQEREKEQAKIQEEIVTQEIREKTFLTKLEDILGVTKAVELAEEGHPIKAGLELGVKSIVRGVIAGFTIASGVGIARFVGGRLVGSFGAKQIAKKTIQKKVAGSNVGTISGRVSGHKVTVDAKGIERLEGIGKRDFFRSFKVTGKPKPRIEQYLKIFDKNALMASRFAHNSKSVGLSNSLLTKTGYSLAAAGIITAAFGTYPWAAHNFREASEALTFPMKQALEAGDIEGYDKLRLRFEEVSDPNLFNSFVNKIPGVNVVKSSLQGMENARLSTIEMDRLRDEIIRDINGEGEFTTQFDASRAGSNEGLAGL